ncbi:hypothetical protein AB6G19_20635 [Providencia manganoxydans]
MVVSAYVITGATSLFEIGGMMKRILLSPQNINVDTLLSEFIGIFLKLFFLYYLPVFFLAPLSHYYKAVFV